LNHSSKPQTVNDFIPSYWHQKTPTLRGPEGR